MDYGARAGNSGKFEGLPPCTKVLRVINFKLGATPCCEFNVTTLRPCQRSMDRPMISWVLHAVD